jgi:hypothetical protein
LVHFFQTCKVKGQDDEEFGSLSHLFFLFLSYKGEGRNDEECRAPRCQFLAIVYGFKSMTTTGWLVVIPIFISPNF